VAVDGDGARALADRQAGVARQIGVGAHADREDHHIGGQGAGRGLHRAHAAVVARPAEDRLHAGAGHHAHALGLHVLFDEARHVRVEHREDLVQFFNDGHAAAVLGQRLGHLHADQAAADNHNVFGPRFGERRLDPFGVFHLVQGVHAELVHAGQRRFDRPRAGAEHQFVVGEPFGRLGAAGRSHADTLLCAVDAQRHGRVADLHVFDFAEENRVAHHADRRAHQLPLLLDHARDVVRKPAARI